MGKLKFQIWKSSSAVMFLRSRCAVILMLLGKTDDCIQKERTNICIMFWERANKKSKYVILFTT